MHKVFRWLTRGLVGGFGVLVVLLAGALAYSGLSQRLTLASTRIDAERGIESLERGQVCARVAPAPQPPAPPVTIESAESGSDSDYGGADRRPHLPF